MKVCTIGENQWKVEFTYSPLFEMLCSIHVLVSPAHHLERIAWAEDMRSRMPGGLLEELIKLGGMTSEWCAIMDFCNLYEECDDFNVIAALDFVDDLDAEAFREVFLKYKELKAANPDEYFKKRMIRALKEYYLGCFEKELRFIEPLLIRIIRKDSEVCKAEGVLKYTGKLHGRIEVTGEAILFHKYTLFTIPLETLRRIIIRISSFISPHLLMDYGTGMVQFTMLANLDKKTERVPVDLLKLTKALSDETRLKILRGLHKGRASTQSLAMELDYTEACISKHLKILYDAGLLYKERDSKYIYYHMNSYLIDRIPQDIYEYMGF